MLILNFNKFNVIINNFQFINKKNKSIFSDSDLTINIQFFFL